VPDWLKKIAREYYVDLCLEFLWILNNLMALIWRSAWKKLFFYIHSPAQKIYLEACNILNNVEYRRLFEKDTTLMIIRLLLFSVFEDVYGFSKSETVNLFKSVLILEVTISGTVKSSSANML
jgi:hypothetical protein